jgi:hypothetical protein
MDRQRRLLRLAEAELHVTDGPTHIENQRRLIRALERDGYATATAHAFLETILETQALCEHHRDGLVRELGQTDDQAG